MKTISDETRCYATAVKEHRGGGMNDASKCIPGRSELLVIALLTAESASSFFLMSVWPATQ